LGGLSSGFALASIVVGAFLLVGFYYQVIPNEWLFGFDRSIIVLGFCFAIVLIGKLFGRQQPK